MAGRTFMVLMALFLCGAQAASAGTLRFRYAVKTPLPMRQVTDARELMTWLGHNGFDIAGMNLHKSEIEVITDEAGLTKLDQAGLKGRTIKVTGANDTGVDSNYYSPDRIAARLNAIHAQYPTLTRLETIGTSLEGVPILAMIVSTTPNDGDPAALAKPTLMVDGQHHAREVQTSHIALDIAETMLADYAASPQAAELAHWNLWVVPMLNVDGTNIVFNSDSMWRKNARGDGANTFGVDLNRNYPYRWGDCDGSSGDTSDDTYRGASAASEPETQALMSLATLAHPTASLSYHSYSELVLYPYGCTGSLTGENELESRVAGEMAALLPTDDGSGNYTPEPAYQLYAVDGDSMDWIFAQFGALSYTFEVNEDFQPDFSILPQTLTKNRAAWKHFLSESDQNMLTVKVVDSRATTGVPAGPASIGIASIPHTQGEQPFSTNAAGLLFKVVDPGTYVLSVTLPDGRTASASVTMAGAPNQVTIRVP